MINPLAKDLDHILSNTGDLWEELRGRNIFITGGTGFFGCWLLESFAWANDRLNLGVSATVLTRNPEAFKRKAPHLAAHPAVRFHIGDVRSFDFPAGEFSHIIHAATEASATLNSQDPLLMFDTVVQGTRHTLEFARRCGVEKFLLTSSGAVYGKQPPELSHIPEDYPGSPDPCDPHSAYGEGKRTAELMSVLYSRKYGFESKIARCFAFVGPYLPLDLHFAIGNFIRDGLNGGPIQVKGDGTPYRSYLYAADLAIWLWTIMLKGESCRPYNVGSGESFTIAEVANHVAEAFGNTIEIHVANMVSQTSPVERYVPDIGSAEKELRLKAIITLQDAISKTILFNKRNGLLPMEKMTADKELRLCPICCGCQVEILHTQRFVLPENHPLARGYNVVSCVACGFVYADAPSNQCDYDFFYSNYSKYEDEKTGTGGGQSWWDFERIKRTAGRISDFLANNKETRILDVGCANGGLLSCLKDFGFTNLYGIDPSTACAEKTRKLGIQAFPASLFDLPHDIGSFDLVILSHVLEHVYDLKYAMQIVRGLTGNEGLIYAEVPGASKYQDYVIAPFQDFNTEHINHFTLHSLKNLMSIHGFHEEFSGQNEILAAPGKNYPIAFAFYQKINAFNGTLRDNDAAHSIETYIALSHALLERIEMKLKKICEEKVIIWGTGQLAMKLLADTSLGRMNIAAFVDNNPVNWDKRINGVPVVSPKVLKEKNLSNPIIIATTLHQESIIDQIGEMNLTNDVITLG